MATKKCTKCKRNRNTRFFSEKAPGKLHYYCKECHSNYRKEHYKTNRDKYIKKAQERKVIDRAIVADKIASIKDVPCADCGIKYPHYVMDFDHINGDKVKAVSRLARDASWETVEKEIAKCEVVCSNCHRERTFQRNRPRSG